MFYKQVDLKSFQTNTQHIHLYPVLHIWTVSKVGLELWILLVCWIQEPSLEAEA